MQRTDPLVALYGASAINSGGTGVYTARLIQGFREEGLSSVHVIGGGSRNRYGKFLMEHIALPLQLRRGSYRLLHLPAFGGAPVHGTPYAVTVHDTAFLDNPRWFPVLKRIYYRLHFTRVARGAAVIIADSRFTTRRIGELLGLKAETVYLSAPENRVNGGLFRRKFSLEKEYIIYTGTMEPRKNISSLVKAWRTVMKSRNDLVLVLAGRWGWGSESERKLLENTRGVLWTGRLTHMELQSAVSGSRMMVYPSLYEGFGLPPLEAAAAGVPSVLGPAEVLREVYGEVALGFCDESPESIAPALLNSLEMHFSSSDLRDFAAGFTAGKMARNTMKCYRKALN